MSENQSGVSTQRELSADEQKTLKHRIEIYAADAPYAVNNANSNFRTLFTDKFSPEDVLQGATDAYRAQTITTAQRHAYQKLFGGE